MKLAAKADLSVGYMNDVERGRRWVGAATLARLARRSSPEALSVFSREW